MSQFLVAPHNCRSTLRLIQACCKGHVSLAIRLVTEYHANMYPQRHTHLTFHSDVAAKANIVTFSPCLAKVAYEVADSKARIKLLECFMHQKDFYFSKTIVSIHYYKTHKPWDLTALALFATCSKTLRPFLSPSLPSAASPP
jgi:hypothetical protein